MVSADVGLDMADCRAGVAGRAPAGGKVIIQTHQPENYAIRAAASQDHLAFYRQEMAFREETGNPPFGKLIRLVYTHTNGALCQGNALRLYRVIKQQRDERGLSDIDLMVPTRRALRAPEDTIGGTWSCEARSLERCWT